MSEARRATLMPFGGEKPGDRSAVDDDRKRTAAPCVRLTFVLPESNEGTCPVYNYKEEFAAVKKKEKVKQQNGKTTATNGLDPFDDDDDDVKRIAMEMEAKYGSGPPTKKKRKGRRDDYADIGMGYDESDSFIDNTDGYDEIIPQNVTTLHGGFYINCGALEFKADDAVSSDDSSSSSSSSSEDEDDDKPKERPEGSNRKRVLDTSSEGEMEGDKIDKEKEEKEQDKDKNKEYIEKKQKHYSVTNGMPLKKKKEAIEKHLDKFALLKKPNSLLADEVKKKSVKDLLKEKRDEPSACGAAAATTQPMLTISDTLKRSLSDVIESVVASSETDKKSDSCVYVTSIKSPALVPSSEGENSRDSVESLDIVQLPENLPSNISDIIRRLKESVQKNKESNKDVFSGSVNSLLITFERKSKVLGKQSRSRIYQHMASTLKIKKEIFCKHAKNLVMDEDSKRLSTLLTDLKTKVLIAMPQLMEAYEQETFRIAHLKADTEENKSLRMPKRKFPWNEEMRKMLREIIIIKKRLLIYEGKTKETIEIHLNLFIKSDVHVLWPDGWMTMAALFKLCNSFERKQPGLISSNTELNSSLENVLVPGSLPNNIPKPKEKKEKFKEVKGLKVFNSKDIQKFAATSVSITPIVMSDNMKTKPSIKPINDITDSVAMPKQHIPVAHRSTIQARNILKTDKHEVDQATVSDRQTKFINLAHHASVPENLTKKLSTDYNIESIISKKSEVPLRRNSEILIPKEEDKGNRDISVPNASSESSKIPIENFMPRPLAEVKKEGEDEVIVLDDNLDDEVSGGSASRTSGDMRRRPGPKSKTKYCDPATIKSVKCASNQPTSSINDKKSIKLDGIKEKRDLKNDGDDILQLMENLKELNKMSTPSKIMDTSPSSAVSVIAYNKNFSLSPTTTGSSKYNDQPKSTSDFSAGLTFHDVYQRQFLNDLNSLATSTSSQPTTTTKNYNSAHTTTSSHSQDKHYSSNNNYTTTAGQGTKLKNNFQHAASHKQKPSSK